VGKTINEKFSEGDTEDNILEIQQVLWQKMMEIRTATVEVKAE